ncbi:hypothetical protein [Maricaulis sp.]|nr:hypothetical protein [Maricaulis sp.]MDF1769221.1 hypothetical protein [Maricaulis sp.]
MAEASGYFKLTIWVGAPDLATRQPVAGGYVARRASGLFERRSAVI